MHPDEGQQHTRDQQHVHGEEARDDRIARELAVEQEEGDVGAHHRHRLHEAVRGTDAGAGQQVIGKGVTGEPLEAAQQQEQTESDADDHWGARSSR